MLEETQIIDELMKKIKVRKENVEDKDGYNYWAIVFEKEPGKEIIVAVYMTVPWANGSSDAEEIKSDFRNRLLKAYETKGFAGVIEMLKPMK